MLFRNYTPFSPLHFESRDEKQNDFGVLVLYGTFQYEDSGRLSLVQKQEPVPLQDKYHGEPGLSSLHIESGLAPFKPKTDVLVTANAYAPSGRPERNWNVSVHIGELCKRLTVTGPRSWTRAWGRVYELGEPEPTTSVPVTYENAFGGRFIDKETGEENRWGPNPVGTGYVVPNGEENIRAPQVLPFGRTSLQLGEPIESVGLGPIAPSWSPRPEKAGTFNAVWEKTRWPDLPADFSFEFYNSAATGLTLPNFAKGNEMIELINLTPHRRLRIQLPGYELATLSRFEDGTLAPGPVFLDTIHVETLQRRVFLTWRAVFPVHIPLRVLEVRAQTSESVSQRQSRPMMTRV